MTNEEIKNLEYVNALWNRLEQARQIEGSADHAKMYFFELLSSLRSELAERDSRIEALLENHGLTKAKIEIIALKSELAEKEDKIKHLSETVTHQNYENFQLKSLCEAADKAIQAYHADPDDHRVYLTNLVFELNAYDQLKNTKP